MKEYSAYVMKISASGRHVFHEGLYKKPEFLQELHESEQSRARHKPPAIMSYSNTTDCKTDASTPNSSRKRKMMRELDMIKKHYQQDAESPEAIVSELRKGSEEKIKLQMVLERLMDRLEPFLTTSKGP